MKKLIITTITILTLVSSVVFMPKVKAAGTSTTTNQTNTTQNTSPYGPYGKKHIPTDTGGTLNSIVLASIGSYVLGSVIYTGAKVLEKKQNA